jgi:hypothetical protein
LLPLADKGKRHLLASVKKIAKGWHQGASPEKRAILISRYWIRTQIKNAH